MVSVLMTAYNRELFIGEAIESVLASTYTNFELIIVDDCSVDNTVSIAKHFQEKDSRIKLIVNKTNLGDYPNRNKAATYAKGKYLKYLDSDDTIYPHSLDIMVNAMENNPDIVLGLSHFKAQESLNVFPARLSPEEIYLHHFLKGGLLFAGPGGTIIRTDYFNTTGGFSGKRYVSDTELWLKTSQKLPVLILQPALVCWRRHEGQEFTIGHTNESYVRLNYELNKAFLETTDCPLKEYDRLVAIRNYKNRFARKIIKKITLAKFAQARNMKKYSGIGTNDILMSFVPINKIKRLLSKSFTNSWFQPK